jgi:branched-chain amino acid transport system ATP-binding protein
MSVSDEIVVLNYGEKLAEGSAHEVRNLQTVISAYLGEAGDA